MDKLGTMLQIGRTFGVRDGMLRLKYEFERGSGLMSWKMRKRGWGVHNPDGAASSGRLEEMRAAPKNGELRFFFRDVRTLGPEIQKIIGLEGKRSVVAEAENILRGHLPFFGQLSYECGFPPRWFQNPATGQNVSPRQTWTQMRFASPAYGDLKFILEPSRFLFAYPLLRAYALTGDERFPEAFWTALEDWAEQSPPMAGPLWICGQECALRILAWSFALHGFMHSPSTSGRRFDLLVSMIAAHARRIERTVGYARSQRSNHLISEGVGLWTAGTLHPELREAAAWRKLGAQLLQEAVRDQITREGVSQQHSFNYQRMILHLLLWTVRLADCHHDPLGEEIRDRTRAALNFMRPWVDDTSGSAPNYGSDDGSSIFPLTTCPHRDFRPLLQLGSAVLHDRALPHGPWDEAALWFGVQPGSERKSETVASSSSSSFANEAGYFRLGDKKSWAMIRAGHYTRRPFQADQLHVDVWWRGVNLARDAGTYLYNGPAPWNNGLAGSAVHNTITIDKADQMRRASRFLWLDWARGRGRLYSSSPGAGMDSFAGEHDGYRKLGVVHRRSVRWLGESGWVVVDDIVGSGEHDVRLHWLAADFPFTISDAPFEVVFRVGESRIRWNVISPAQANASVVRAGKLVWGSEDAPTDGESETVQGWVSDTYGELRPAVSLAFQARSRLPLRFVTAVLTDARCELTLVDGQLIVTKGKPGSESEIYRVNILKNAAPDETPHSAETRVPAL